MLYLKVHDGFSCESLQSLNWFKLYEKENKKHKLISSQELLIKRYRERNVNTIPFLITIFKSFSFASTFFSLFKFYPSEIDFEYSRSVHFWIFLVLHLHFNLPSKFYPFLNFDCQKMEQFPLTRLIEKKAHVFLIGLPTEPIKK